MRLIYINRYFFPDESATSRMMSSLAFALAGEGWSVEVITSRQRHDDVDARLPAFAVVEGVSVHRIWTTRFGRDRLAGRAVDYLSFSLGAFWGVLRLAGRGDIVIACTDPPLLSLPACVAARLAGAKLINWLQDLFPEIASALRVGGVVRAAPLLRWLRNASLRLACSNVVPGERMARYLRDQGIDPRRIAIIHNWSDGAEIHPIEPARNALRRRWGLEGKFVAGYSGNMGRVHDFTTILAAAEGLRHRVDVVFLFIGGGHRKAWIEGEARLRGLTNIMMKPLQPEHSLCESLSVPDVHLVSLRPEIEGFVVPSKFYGIAAAGRPTLFIGDPEGEIATIIEKTRCGAAVKMGDGAGLIGNLVELCRSADLRRRWGENARRLLLDRFDLGAAVAAWCRVIASAADPQGTSVGYPDMSGSGAE